MCRRSFFHRPPIGGSNGKPILRIMTSEIPGGGGQIRHRCQNSEAASIDVAWNETSSGKPEYAAFSACEKDRLPRNFGCRRSHSKQRQSPAQVVTRETEIRRAPLESAGLDGWTAGLNRSKIIREIDPTSCRRCLVPM